MMGALIISDIPRIVRFMVSGIFMIFTRRRGLSFIVQMLFFYFASQSAGLLAIGLVFGIETLSENIGENMAFGIVAAMIPAVIFAVAAVIATRLLYKDSIEGFKSGFRRCIGIYC